MEMPEDVCGAHMTDVSDGCTEINSMFSEEVCVTSTAEVSNGIPRQIAEDWCTLCRDLKWAHHNNSVLGGDCDLCRSLQWIHAKNLKVGSTLSAKPRLFPHKLSI